MFRFHDYPILHFLEGLRAEYRKDGREVEFLPFAYNADFIPINASSSGNVVSSTDHDSDFVIMATMQAAFTTAGVFTRSPQCTVRITHDVSGRRFEDRDTALINVFGKGERPFWWARPVVVKARSSWTTTINNLDAANAFNLRLTYWGAKAVSTPSR